MKKTISIVFPHQLFKNTIHLKECHEVYLIEEHLFFKEFKFHKQKLAFHRATMRTYFDYLTNNGFKVFYIESTNCKSDIRRFLNSLDKDSISKIKVINPIDNWLEKRIRKYGAEFNLEWFESSLFINTAIDNEKFFNPAKKSYFQTKFYKQQRKRLNLLIEKNGDPIGGKWTYDTENRKKYPKGQQPPNIEFPKTDKYWEESLEYIESNFKNNPGNVSKQPMFPINFNDSNNWLKEFLQLRFYNFGKYEDAILMQSSFLHHSVLSPLMNVGLLEPKNVVDVSIKYANEKDIPINSTEGFVRQIIGWREFIRGLYESKGSYSRTKNFWKFSRKIPSSFYNGTTGILPVDETIKKVLKTSYCHHIERLMILGNFMLLCEFDPDEVYQWFMELFIDAYDWVMVPNVYGMSQFADGGLFATKPYIGGSNYIKKMSNYPNGEWQFIWDGLYWRFIAEHQDFFSSNPRSSMMVHLWNKMSEEKKETHLKNATSYLKTLDKTC